MKLIRMLLMGIGVLSIARFVLDFFQTIDQNQQYLQAKDYAASTAEDVQVGMNSGLNALQGSFGSLLEQLNSNGLFVLGAAICALFLLSLLLRSGTRSTRGSDD